MRELTSKEMSAVAGGFLNFATGANGGSALQANLGGAGGTGGPGLGATGGAGGGGGLAQSQVFVVAGGPGGFAFAA